MFSNITEAWGHDPVKEITNKIETNKKYPQKNKYENDEISLDNPTISLTSNFSSYAPADFDRFYKKSNYVSDTDNKYQNYKNLDRLIDNKINKRFDELLLDIKMKQLHDSQLMAQNPTKNNDNSTKDILIIVMGVLLALLIILLIFKSIN